jgi:hypothetical protein
MLVIPIIFLMVYILYKTGSLNFKSYNISLNTVFIVLILLTFTLNFRKYLFTYEDNIVDKENAMIMHNFINDHHPDDVLISGHLEINQSTALHFGTSFTGRMNVIYKNKLSELYPNQIICNIIHDQLYKLSRSTDLEGMMTSGKKIIFLSDKYNSPESLISKINEEYDIKFESFNLIFTDPYNLNEVKLYEIKLKE